MYCFASSSVSSDDSTSIEWPIAGTTPNLLLATASKELKDLRIIEVEYLKP